MATVASRKELQRWASEVTGQRIGNLETQCRSGAIYCQLVDAARPGAVDMRKVNLKANENNALGNYKALENALSKIGLEEGGAIDIQKLAQGQPQATLELMQTLHAALVTEDGSDTPRAGGRLATLDPNALEGGASSRKRKAALPPAQNARPLRKARSAGKVDEEMAAAEAAPPPAPLPPAAATAEASEASRSTTESLQDQLQYARALLVQSRAEAQNLREELSFYYGKLERIEDVCSCGSPSKAAGAVMRILREEEGATVDDEESEI